MSTVRALLASGLSAGVALMAPPACAQRPSPRGLGGSSVGFGMNGLITAAWQSHSIIAPIDTLRLRHLFVNGGDSAVTVHVRPCGIRVEADVEVVAEPAASCEPEPRTLEPGDSIGADWSGRLIAPPGRHTLTVQYVGVPGDTGIETGHPVEVTIVAAEPDEAPAEARRRGPLLEPYLLRLAGRADHPEARREFQALLMTRHGVHLVPFEPAAALARARSRPILLIDLHVAEPRRPGPPGWPMRIGRHQVTVGWLTVDEDGAETVTCNHGGTGLTALMGLGVDIHTAVAALLERGPRCGR